MSADFDNMTLVSSSCDADYAVDAGLPSVVDQRFDDFDAQSEQLSGHDQEYHQLSCGRFQGRFVSAFAGPKLSIHCETANRSLEQWIGCPDGIVSIGLVLEEAAGFVVNGQTLGAGDIMITRPGGEMNLSSPANGAIMAICIDEDELTECCGDGAAAALLSPGRNGVETFHAPTLGQHLRADALRVLGALRQTDSDQRADALSRPLIASIAAQLSLHAVLAADGDNRQGLMNREEFMHTKRLIAMSNSGQIDYSWLCKRTMRSKRSIQSAFARFAGTSPSRYLRLIRLNRVRRALLDRSNESASIGDIAARNGFWSWSRFTQEYKALFCELPSETRQRLQ